MSNELTSKPKGDMNSNARILVCSQRNIFPNALSRRPLYEFEDIISQIDTVDLLTPCKGQYFDLRYRIANRVAKQSEIALNPGIKKIQINGKYDLFFSICAFPKDLLNLTFVNNMKSFCKTSVCLIDEMWVSLLYRQKAFLKILSKFDYVVLYYCQSVDTISKITGTNCFFLPPGVDAIQFCPYPDPPKRVIDLYSYGRMSLVTHRKLLEMTKNNNFYYIYDTRPGSEAINSYEHRLLLANTAKRSRYFIVNPGLIDRPDIRGPQSETGNRYFEGAASGTVMIGERPTNEEFEKLFNWKDAVIPLPYDSDNIDQIIKDLDPQKDRQEEIRRNNVLQSLRKHDWAYRWEKILNVVGLKHMPGLLERKNRLIDLSKIVDSENKV